MITNGQVERTLRVLNNVYNSILDESASYILPQAITEVSATYGDYKKAQERNPRAEVRETWGYTIYPYAPLRFKPTKNNGIDFIVDVYCDIQWRNDDLPVSQDIKIRAWSTHRPTIYHDERDSPNIKAILDSAGRNPVGRVVSRLHFDKANESQAGPEYHMQFGGKPENDELCWFPESVKIPRLEYKPMELFLVCQLVAANFYPDEYAEIKEKSEWLGTLRWSQQSLLLPYYQKCLTALQGDISLLDHMWMK